MHGTEAPSEWVQRWVHWIAPGARVLDVACGAGRHMRFLSAKGHAVLGLDRSETALQAASEQHMATLWSS